jgi:Ca2+-binding RTX toxin-like protein
MKALLSDLQKGVNLPHTARFALTSFLANIGLDKEQIMELYRMAPDFREDLTRYQVEHITGGSGADTLFGDFNWDPSEPGPDVIPSLVASYHGLDAALHGDDVIDGGDGDDELWGNGGNDELYGNVGRDSIWGGAGNDFITGNTGVNFLYGEAGNDHIVSAGTDRIDGGPDADVIDYQGDDTVVAF